MNEKKWYRIWVSGSVMYEVNVEVFDISGEMIPLVDLLFLLSPIVFVGPDFVQIGGPLCGEAVFGACALDDILRRNSGVSDLAIVALDFGVRYVDLERTDLV